MHPSNTAGDVTNHIERYLEFYCLIPHFSLFDVRMSLFRAVNVKQLLEDFIYQQLLFFGDTTPTSF